MTREQLAEVLATHESGHTIAGLALGLTVQRVCCRLDPPFGMTYFAKQEPGAQVEVAVGNIVAGQGGATWEVPCPLVFPLPKDPDASGVSFLAGPVAVMRAKLAEPVVQVTDKQRARHMAHAVAAVPGETRTAEEVFAQWWAEAFRVLKEHEAGHRELTALLVRGMLERNEVSISPALAEGARP